MHFRSKFLDHVPFSTLGSNRYTQKALTAAERAEKKLQQRLVNPDRLMYRGGEDKIFDSETRRLFTGIVRIDNGDKFERILRIKNGTEASSLVRVKGGKNYQAEIVGGNSKKFDTGLSTEELTEQTEKMIKADEAFYNKMLENFKKRKLFTIKKQ